MDDALSTPQGLMTIALGLGIVGAASLALGLLISKAMGLSGDDHARRTRHNRGAASFYSDLRNVPVFLVGSGGFSLFGSVVVGVIGGLWWLFA